jgi:hypothetical protein
MRPLALAFSLLLALPARADDPPPPNLAPLRGAEGAAARLIEAHRLHAIGLSARDPVVVLAAARLMQGVTLREVTRTPATPVAEPEEKPRKKKAKAATPDLPPADPLPTTVPDPAQSAPLPGALDVHAMMEEARALVPEGELLRDVIVDAESETPPPGPVAEVTSLVQSPGGATTFAVALAGDSYSEIGLLRLGAGLLTLGVTDAAGNPVCQDASAGPSALCGIVPRESDHFLVTITNEGAEPAPYLLITN